MAELTIEQVSKMTMPQIIARFRQAAIFQRNHRAITWEHGTDLVNIVAGHGDKIADAIEASGEMLAALENIENGDGHMPPSAWKLIQDAIAKAKGE